MRPRTPAMQTSLSEVLNRHNLTGCKQDADLAIVELEPLLELAAYCIDFRAPLAPQIPKLIETLSNKRISTPFLNACVFCDYIIYNIVGGGFLDSELADKCNQLRKPLLLTLLRDASFADNDGHFVKSMLDQVFQLILGWYDELGEQHPDICALIHTVIDALNDLDGYDYAMPQSLQKALINLRAALDPFHQKVEKIKNSETQLLEDRKRIYTVDTFLDEKYADKTFHPAIIDFLSKTWRSTLLHYLKKKGEFSEQWETLVEFTSVLVNIFSAEVCVVDDYLISGLRPKLVKYIVAGENEKRRAFKDIDYVLDLVLKGETFDSKPITPYLEKNRLKHLKFGSSIVKTVTSLRCGQLLHIYNKNGLDNRLQLVGILRPSQELVFTDFMGSNIWIRSFQGVGYSLLSKNARIIDGKGLFSAAFSRAKNQVTQLYTQIEENHKKQKLALKKELDLQQKHRDMEARYIEELRRLKHSENTTKESLNSEIDKILEQKKALERALEEKQKENLQFQAKEIVDGLTIGSWLSLSQDDGSEIHCKIAVIYGSSGKYVLTDAKGQRIAEYPKAEMTTLLNEQKLKVIAAENTFESSVEKVIKSLKE